MKTLSIAFLNFLIDIPNNLKKNFDKNSALCKHYAIFNYKYIENFLLRGNCIIKPIARKDDLVIQEVGEEILVYDLRTNKAICLNQTSALVWQNCDGKKDAMEIAKKIEKELGSNVSEDFVWFAVNQLEKENLLIENKNKFDKFNGLSRREVIKKIGLSSMVALPVVATLVAPSAAMAQSNCGAATGRGNGCACTLSSQCMSGCCKSSNSGGSGMNTCITSTSDCS